MQTWNNAPGQTMSLFHQQETSSKLKVCKQEAKWISCLHEYICNKCNVGIAKKASRNWVKFKALGLQTITKLNVTLEDVEKYQ